MKHWTVITFPQNNHLQTLSKHRIIKKGSTVVETAVVVVLLLWIRWRSGCQEKLRGICIVKITSPSMDWNILKPNHVLTQNLSHFLKSTSNYMNYQSVAICSLLPRSEKQKLISNMGAVLHRCKIETWLWNNYQAHISFGKTYENNMYMKDDTKPVMEPFSRVRG